MYKFKRDEDSGLILLNITIDRKYKFKMVLDTGATNTTIDSNALHVAGYELKDSIGVVEIETANGVTETEIFEVNQFAALGMVRENFQIQIYDFLAHGIYSDYNGLLGLDFLEGTTFRVDMLKETIELN
jgi:predicted aspartyl protease